MRNPLLKSLVLSLAVLLGPVAPATAGGDADSDQEAADEPAAGSEATDDEPTLLEALRGGATAVDFRYRYEFVSDEAFPLDAHASTLGTTLAYETAPYRGFRLGVEVENVRPIGRDLYDNRGAGHRRNARPGRPVVADPGLTEINQATLRYQARPGTELTLGRQELLFDDQRFVGPVGWRQNRQSFDALRLDTDVARGRFRYALLRNVHRVSGAVDPLAGHLVHASFGARARNALTLYGYALDYERDRHRSSTTFGAELVGSRALSARAALLYEVEAARQLGAFGNPTTLEAGYLHLAAGGRYRGLTVRAGWERLGGSPDRGQFNTTLATLHPFQGWADQFLVTPADGIDDLYVRVLGAAGRFRWTVAWHDFRAATGSARHGRELDLEVVYATPWGQQLAVTAARYDAEAHSTDTTKLMVWTTFGF